MEYRRLGNTGMYVSEISYGNWITHGNQVEATAANACVKAAFDAGITTFDTADVYAGTKAETILGKALKGVRRESYELFTKVYFPTGTGKNDRGLSRKHIIESCNASLKRLQTDHIDLYQAHRFDYETPLEETLSAFDDLIRQGKVHYIGVSNWKHTEIQDALKIQDDKGYNRIVSNQPSYSAIYRVIEAKIVPLCEREGISQIVYSPLAQGVLTGKYQPGKKVPTDSRGANKNNSAQFMQGMMNDEFLGYVAKLQPIADAHGITMSQLALAWILSNPNVASAIMGATKPKQVTENAKGSGIKLEPAVIKEINAVLKPITKTDPNLTTSPKPRS
jgi:aryl-alcohol dehydrogenase-like predicted oxidoreductase